EDGIRHFHVTGVQTCALPILNLTEAPVTIKTIECAIVDRGWQEGWIAPQRPAAKTGKKIAIVGAGPAGLAAAQQLSRRGHEVHRSEERRGGEGRRAAERRERR